MKLIPEIAKDVSAALFVWYGVCCFLSQKMIAEFDRYRLPHRRLLTGILQLVGSFG
jgi:hypothetical protein